MKTVSAIDFVRFLSERCELKDGVFPGAKGFSPKELFSLPAFLSLSQANQDRLKEKFKEKQRIWGSKEIVFDYYKQITGEKIFAPIQGIFSDWCEWFKDTNMNNYPRIPGVFLFKKGSNGTYNQIAITYQSSYIGQVNGNWKIFIFNSSSHELKTQTLEPKEWDGWGMPTKYFDYGKYSLELTDGSYFGATKLYKGVRGPNVIILQSCLIALKLLDKNYMSGVFDEETEQALSLFQSKYELPITGELNAKTLETLLEVVEV